LFFSVQLSPVLTRQAGAGIYTQQMKNIPIPVWRLMIAYALMMAGASLMVLIAGIIGTEFAPSADLATLPIALVVVGVASSTLPTGKLFQYFGRRRVFIGYGVLAVAAAVLAFLSLTYGTFAGFCLAACLMGWSGAGAHQYRFAALELVPATDAAKATSVLLLGGILGAVVGPELAVRGRALLPVEYAGSYLLLAGAYVLGLVIVSFHPDAQVTHTGHQGRGRPLSEILRSPVVILAISAAAFAYGVMSFIMTATPISMHRHAGHSLDATKFVIQSHIAAMYLPSLVYAWFLSKMGFRGMLWSGVLAYLACLAVLFAGIEFANYWLALVVLGIGWNFLFLSGTNLLPHGYRPEERFGIQSMNDFMVFSIQAIVTLSSGWFLFHWQWRGVLWACVPLLFGFAVLLWLTKALDRSFAGKTANG
jgi:MFS family permease